MQTPQEELKSKTFSEIYFAVHTIFTKVWKTTSLLAKSTLKQEKKYLNGQKTNLYFMLDMPQVKFR
jgi:hypothetical protein